MWYTHMLCVRTGLLSGCLPKLSVERFWYVNFRESFARYIVQLLYYKYPQASSRLKAYFAFKPTTKNTVLKKLDVRTHTIVRYWNREKKCIKPCCNQHAVCTEMELHMHVARKFGLSFSAIFHHIK